MVMDLLKKDIKIDRKVVIMFVIFNFLIMGLYYTYSIFVIKQIKDNVSSIVVNTNIINVVNNDLTDDKITVSAGSSKDTTFTLVNSSSITMYYRIMHKGVPTGVSIYETSSDNASAGSISSNGNITSQITINNTTTEEVTIEFLVQESKEEKFDKEMDTSYVNVSASFDHSGANVPSLPSNMIPVYYVPGDGNETEGTWVKADVNNNNESHIWYDYDNFRWANAVTVTDTNRSTYLSAESGTTIVKDDINAFFVWIPKYKYYVVSGDGNPSYERLININFLGRNDIDESGTVTCVESISTTDNPHLYSEICTDSVYGSVQNNLSTYTHPSFVGNDTGFWVGKFANRNYSTIQIVDNTQVYNGGSAATSSYVRQMINETNPFGFEQASTASYDEATWLYTDGNNALDTHPITSMEWGAIAILTNSVYGKSGNPMYSNETIKSFSRVYNNPSTQYTGRITNYKSGDTSLHTNSSTDSEYYYLTDATHTTNEITYPIGQIGPGASTTGTIYGVYDMSGGNYTTVMGVVMKEDGTVPTTNYKMDSSFYTAYSYMPYTGIIDTADKSAYLEVFRLGDGIKEHVRTFTENGMWQDGTLTLNNTGIMRRGGYTTTGSLFSTEITSSTSTYEVFTVLKYNPE